MSETGKKNDAGKPPLELIPREALEGMARVLAFGARKYAPDNWRGGFAWRRLIGAGLRHLVSFGAGEDLDPESGLPHVDHALCCLAFLSAHVRSRLGTDDRWKPSTPEVFDARDRKRVPLEELEAAGAPLARGARLPEAASTPASEAAEPAPAPASVPCAECGTRDGNGECSAQCVREESGPAASPAEPEATGVPIQSMGNGMVRLGDSPGSYSNHLLQNLAAQVRDCVSCRHSADDGTVYPCRPCLTEFRRAGSFPNWTPAPPAPPPMRECVTCLHRGCLGVCGGCRVWSRWEPRP